MWHPSPPPFEAWRRYVSTGALKQDLLRAPVFRAWERSHEQGADPQLMRAEALSPPALKRVLGLQQAVLSAAHPFLRALSAAAGGERHAAMLSDAQAVVLAVEGDEASVYGPERVPGPGALLSEELCGANGLGTALAEGGYVELVGPEHFIQGFHLFSCQGIPFRTPEGEVAGALSTSVRRPEASVRLREILVCAAHGIEAELLRGRLEEDLARVAAAAPDDARPLERLRQDVVQVQATARLKLHSAARAVARHRQEEDQRLVQQAEQALNTFRRRAALWRLLATEARAPACSMDLLLCVRALEDLLQTELAVRQVSLRVEGESVLTLAEPPALYRLLFRRLMRALDQAGAGGTVRACVWPQGLWIPGKGEPEARLLIEVQPADELLRA